MSYTSIWDCAHDPDLRNRVTVCVQTLAVAPAGPEAWVTGHMLAVAATPAIAAAWEHSALTNPYHGRRGHDPAIITDQMIQDAVTTVAGGGETS